jgi:ankyrin repeat protein
LKGAKLIKKGLDENNQFLNLQNAVGETALHKAMFNHSTRLLMVEMLISHGIEVNTLNIYGETALSYAVRLQRTDLIASLAAAGADMDLKVALATKNSHF